ncbi:hypothetical protein E2C01_054594 [Portunus trituberculatus]|uniref:Uncharacterized protein n=1 Tax=Portunus trituberculatus TaxID=210409 RepID=A0A5B7GSE6_PORTR|nr:hypothetical protein [Portunus trituberculatus]
MWWESHTYKRTDSAALDGASVCLFVAWLPSPRQTQTGRRYCGARILEWRGAALTSDHVWPGRGVGSHSSQQGRKLRKIFL